MVEVVDISSDEDVEEKVATDGAPVKDSKSPAPLGSSQVQDEVDWDLLEVEIREEEATTKVKKEEVTDSISVKEVKVSASSSPSSSSNTGEDGQRG